MTAEVRKIQSAKSLKDGRPYTRVYFRSDIGETFVTDIVEGFRNFKNWDGKLKVGNILSGLTPIQSALKPKRIDADSMPVIVETGEDDQQQDLF